MQNSEDIFMSALIKIDAFKSIKAAELGMLRMLVTFLHFKKHRKVSSGFAMKRKTTRKGDLLSTDFG